MRVLIVDDREDNRLLLREQLRELNAEVLTAASGVLALRELRARPVELVVTDLLMPEMDGFQLCYLIKTDPVLKKTPVVIYTANYATRKDEEQARNLGADDFITRPIDEDVLTERLRRVVNRVAATGAAEPCARPEEGFFQQYSSLLIEKLEDQLILAEENARLLAKNAELQRELELANADLKKSNAELLRVNEDLESFSYSVSHDLRAPVRAIEGMLKLLVEEVEPALTPDARRFVSRIEYNAERMNALITGVLGLSRMRNVADAMHPIDLEAVVAGAVMGHHFAITAANAKVRIDSPMPRVIGHYQALTQVITNLLDNAMKFVAPGTIPEVTISAARHGDRVRLKIRDNGIGIRAESQHRLFRVFERLTVEPGYPGTGIGLAIVRRGVERMGGEVGVESAAGEGSTFWVELNAAN